MDAEQTQVNLLVVKAFEALRIPYVLGGSMASSVHGIYRATADADFVAAVRPHHAEPLAALLQPAFYEDAGAPSRASCASLMRPWGLVVGRKFRLRRIGSWRHVAGVTA